MPYKRGMKWYAQVRKDGLKREKIFLTKKEAVDWEAEMRRKPVSEWLEKTDEGKCCTLFTESPCKERCGLFAGPGPFPLHGKICTILCKNGELRTIRKNADLLQDEAGNIVGTWSANIIYA